MTEEQESVPPTPKIPPDLPAPEAWWRDRQQWLAERGYMLRPRYRPGWQPSWIVNPQKLKYEYEDMKSASSSFILDAVRTADNSLVVMKKVKSSRNPHEVEISQYLSSEALRSDPRNHSVPILDSFGVPDEPEITILVLPLLRACNDPSWQTVGEVLSFIKQIFEGLQYLHELHVAHRLHLIEHHMFHPRNPYKALDYQGPPKHSTRTARPVKYYFIDFGLSRRYNPEDGPPREDPIRGADKSVPEFKDWNGEPLDPFPTDVYYLGNVIREAVLKRYHGMKFLDPLVQDMIQADPSKRPTIQEVVRRFDELLKRTRFWTLWLRPVPINEETAVGWYRNTRQLFRTVGYVLSRKSTIPIPS